MAAIPVFYLNKDDHVAVKHIELNADAHVLQLCDEDLLITLPDERKVPLRTAYHAGKQFDYCYGPYKDLLTVDLSVAEKDPRILCGRELTGYWFGERVFSPTPVPYFYTWLYLKALAENPDLVETLMQYSAFSDSSCREKDPGRMPAFSAAIFLLLNKKQKLQQAEKDKKFLKEVIQTEYQQCFKDLKKGQEKDKNDKDQIPTKELIKNMRFPTIYKKGDTIEHPEYGKGKIIDIKTWNTFAHLIVVFEEISSVKRLSESWVRLHCRY